MIFNEQELLRYTEGDHALSTELLQMAVSDMPDFLEKAQNERRKNNLMDAAEFLHKIKGIAGCIGAVRVHKISSEMETDIKTEGTSDFFDQQINPLKDAVSDFTRDSRVRTYLT